MPAWAVMSRKCTDWAWLAVVPKAMNHRDTEVQRNQENKIPDSSLWLCDSVVNFLLGKIIYLEAPAEEGWSFTDWTAEAAVPIWLETGKGTDRCSCTACRLLLSSG